MIIVQCNLYKLCLYKRGNFVHLYSFPYEWVDIQSEEPDGLWIMDFMDLDLQIKTPWILDGFGFTKEIHEINEIHKIHEFRSTILIIRNIDKLIIYYQFIIVSYD